MENLVKTICQKEGITVHNIRALTGGQVNQVFLADDAYVIRIGAREDAFLRLQQETGLLQSLAGRVPVPQIYAFGQQDGLAYQVQQYLPGQKLYLLWKTLSPAAQEKIAEQLAACLKTLHGMPRPCFGLIHQEDRQFDTWFEYMVDKFERTLEEIDASNIKFAPGFVELAAEYFNQHKQVLRQGDPVLVHGDLTLVNILVDGSRLSALLDFEYALGAPADYELWTLEAFCLYPNDWAEEENEVFCAADFASVFPMLRRHYPALFAATHLRERLNLYHIDAALSSYLAWRKDNLNTIPPERLAAKEFYMARITNFIFGHGARMVAK